MSKRGREALEPQAAPAAAQLFAGALAHGDPVVGDDAVGEGGGVGEAAEGGEGSAAATGRSLVVGGIASLGGVVNQGNAVEQHVGVGGVEAAAESHARGIVV